MSRLAKARVAPKHASITPPTTSSHALGLVLHPRRTLGSDVTSNTTSATRSCHTTVLRVHLPVPLSVMIRLQQDRSVRLCQLLCPALSIGICGSEDALSRMPSP